MSTHRIGGIISIVIGILLAIYPATVVFMEPPPLWAMIVFGYAPIAAGLFLIGLGVFLIAKKGKSNLQAASSKNI